MINFEFLNPTKIIFGKNVALSVGKEVAKYSRKILLHYGSGSIKKSGLYDRVVHSLQDSGVEFVELSGVQPNPRLSLVKEGIELCRRNGVDFVLAVGGGSVIDSAKAIAVGAVNDRDVWEHFLDRTLVISEALPIGTILTIPAAGSESSHSAVITNDEGQLKRAIGSEWLYPKFSMLDPESCFTLPAYQAACGATDIMAHIMERYFTNVKNVDFTDRLCEAGLKTIIHNLPKALSNPHDYDAWAEIMWTGTVAHNNLFDTGRIGDWASHAIEHEMSGIYDIAHGAGLAIIFPAWMKYVYTHDEARFAQFAERVWDVPRSEDIHAMALQGIEKLEKFLRSIGMPTSFKDASIPSDAIHEMALKATTGGEKTLGNFVTLSYSDVEEIYKLAQ